MDNCGSVIKRTGTFRKAATLFAGNRGLPAQIGVYLDSVLEELHHADTVQPLDVGVLLDSWATLQRCSLAKDARDQLGEDLWPTLNAPVQDMLGLAHRHFAPSFARLAKLRDYGLAPDEDAYWIA